MKIKFFVSVFVLLFCIKNGFCNSFKASKICVVSASQEDEVKLGLFPWSRNIETKLIGLIENQAPSLVLFTYIFNPNSYYPKADEEFIDFCNRQANLVLGAGGGLLKNDLNPESIDESSFLIKDNTKKIQFRELESIVYPLQGYKRQTPIGLLVIIPYGDKLKVPLILKCKGKFYPSIALAAMAFNGKYFSEIVVGDGQIKTNGKTIPVDEQCQFEIKLSMPGEKYDTYSFTDILENKVGVGELEGKIVIVGYRGNLSPMNYKTSLLEKHAIVDVLADHVSNLIEGELK